GAVGYPGALLRRGRVGLGRGAGVSPGPFPQAALRTQRASYNAPGSPRDRAVGLGEYAGFPGCGDVFASVAVPGEGYRRRVEQLGLVDEFTLFGADVVAGELILL